MTVQWGAVFVCQGGGLERKAAVLAASLRHQNGPGPKLVAAIPGPSSHWARPSERTLSYLKTLGVETVDTENPIGNHYPIGNKFGCLAVMPDVDRCFVLDSDLLALAPIYLTDLSSSPLAVKPEDRPGPWIDRRSWRQLYKWADMSKWERSEEITTTVSQHRIPPYFNAGVVGLDPRSPVGDQWLKWARRIDPSTELPYRHPWLDQIALPLAARSAGIVPQHLDETWNYPAHHWLLREPVRFAHYHEPTVIAEDPMLWAGLRELVVADPELGRILSEGEDWARVLARKQPLLRSQLVVLAASPSADLATALGTFCELGFSSVKLDPAFAKRVKKQPDVTWVATWLRKRWLEHDIDRGPLVLFDDTILIDDVDRVFRSIDGYTVAAWGPSHSGPEGRARNAVARCAPRLTVADVFMPSSLGRWLETADVARSEVHVGRENVTHITPGIVASWITEYRQRYPSFGHGTVRAVTARLPLPLPLRRRLVTLVAASRRVFRGQAGPKA